MAKQKDTLSEKQTTLNDLKVKKSIEETTKYDKQIESIEKEIDYLFWGIK